MQAAEQLKVLFPRESDIRQCQRGSDVFPFVGPKDSAEDTLSVHDALRAFSIRTMVAAKQTEASKNLLDAIVLGNKSNFIHTHFIL